MDIKIAVRKVRGSCLWFDIVRVSYNNLVPILYSDVRLFSFPLRKLFYIVWRWFKLITLRSRIMGCPHLICVTSPWKKNNYFSHFQPKILSEINRCSKFLSNHTCTSPVPSLVYIVSVIGSKSKIQHAYLFPCSSTYHIIWPLKCITNSTVHHHNI